MRLSAYTRVYQRFGLLACIHDLIISLINKFIACRVLVIYVKDSADEHSIPSDLDIHPLNQAELNDYADQPQLELPSFFLREAIANGDECFGAFINGELCGYAWYATRPSTSANGVTAAFSTAYAYAYKNLTLPNYRGRAIQKYIKQYTVAYYQRQGKKGLIVGIESQNFASRASTAGAGARIVGYYAWIQRDNKLLCFGSPGSRLHEFRLYKNSGATQNDTQLRVERLSCLDGLNEHNAAWLALTQKLPRGIGLLYQPWWMHTVASLYQSNNRKPYFLLIYQGAELIGCAPLMIERKGFSSGYLRRLYFWGGIRGTLNNMGPDLLVSNPDKTEQCTLAVCDFLTGAGRHEWDYIELPYLCEESPSLSALQRLVPQVTTSPESMQTFLVDLPNNFSEFCGTLPRKPFSEIKRCHRKLLESGAKIDIIQVDKLDAHQMADIERIHNHRQDEHRTHGNARYSIFQQSQPRAVLNKLLEHAAVQGAARHYLLTINGELAAFFLNFVHGDTLHLFLTAFDTRFGPYGPTKLLLLHVCEQEIEQSRTRLLNLSTGESRYKREFSNRIANNLHLAAVNQQLASRLRYALWTIPRKGKQKVFEILSATRRLVTNSLNKVRKKPNPD